MADPWFRFYPSEWRADPRLRMCSIAARGLWIEMLSIMHEAEPRGHLLVHGRPLTDAQLAVLAGTPPDQLPDLIGELESAGVFSRTSKGVIYSRRMARDTKRAMAARKNGRKGGNPAIVGMPATPSKETGNSTWVNPRVKPPVKPPDKAKKLEARSKRIDADTPSEHQHLSGRARAPDADDDDGGGGATSPAGTLESGRATGADTHRPLYDAVEAVDIRDAVIEAIGVDIQRDRNPVRWLGSEPTHVVGQWLGLGLTRDEILEVVGEVMARRGTRGPPGSLAYFTAAMREAAGRKLAPPLTPIAGGHHGTGTGTRTAGDGRTSRERRAERELDEDLAFARRLDAARR